MQYKNYIFDLYGTLVDIHTDESKVALWKKIAVYFSAQGAAYTGKELKERYGILIGAEAKRLQKKLQKKYPGITVKEVEINLDRVFAALYKEKGVKANKQLIKDSMIAFRAITMEKLRLFPGTIELLQGLRDAGKKVYLLSNAQTSFTYPEMKALGLTEYFDDIFFSSDLEVKKPSARFYEALFEKHGLTKKESVMVGNDRFADVQGALDFGIEAIYLHTEQSTPFEGKLPKGSVQVDCLLDILSL
jgi:putative hydrolase of the HAD superfamily